jgi:hypothetical protein
LDSEFFFANIFGNTIDNLCNVWPDLCVELGEESVPVGVSLVVLAVELNLKGSESGSEIEAFC